jgi:hypothetical protein
MSLTRLEFRDGVRDVPEHVAGMMNGMETWRFPYEEALRVAEQRILADRLNKVQQDIIRDSLRKKV